MDARLLDVLHHRGDVRVRRRRRARRRRARPRSRGSGRRARRRRRRDRGARPRPRRSRPASRARRARTRGGRAPGSRPRSAIATASSGRLAIPQSGQRTPGSRRAGRSARGPRRGRPRRTACRGSGSRRRSIARASFSGVWPPNWMHDARRLLPLEHRQHGLLVERLEVEPVGACRSRSRPSRGCS